MKDTCLATEGMKKVDPKTKEEVYYEKVDDEASHAAEYEKSFRVTFQRFKT